MAAATRLIAHLDKAVPHLRDWIDDMQAMHAAAIAAHINRAAALRDHPAARAPVQRGLFDRRAIVEADSRLARDTALHDEASERIQQLEQSRPLHLDVRPAGVLVLWR